MQYPSISLYFSLPLSRLSLYHPHPSLLLLCEGAIVKCVKGGEGELGRIRIQSVNATKT